MPFLFKESLLYERVWMKSADRPRKQAPRINFRYKNINKIDSFRMEAVIISVNLPFKTTGLQQQSQRYT